MTSNMFSVAVPSLYEALQAGERGYKGMQDIQSQRSMQAARQEAQSALMGGGDTRSALARLIGAGDMQGANALANFGNQSADQAYKSGMLKIAQQQAERREVPEEVRKLNAAGIRPGTPEAAKALFPRTDTPISATDKKAIIDAEDAVPQIQGTIENLTRALDLNDKTYTGYSAGIRGELGTKLPGAGLIFDKETARNTSEWSKIMGPEALQAMANTLKGATTDFELRKFIEMLGNPDTDPQVRKGQIQRMLKLAERKLEIQQSRVKDLRGGSYFKPQDGQPTPKGPPAGGGDLRAQAEDAIRRGADPQAVAKRLLDSGINPEEVGLTW